MSEAETTSSTAPRRPRGVPRRDPERKLLAWCAEMVAHSNRCDELMHPYWESGEEAPDEIRAIAYGSVPRILELRGKIGDTPATTPAALLAKTRAVLADYRGAEPNDRTDAFYAAWSLVRDVAAALQAGTDLAAPAPPRTGSAAGLSHP